VGGDRWGGKRNKRYKRVPDSNFQEVEGHNIILFFSQGF
jgi:hypothetical protein